MFPGPQQPYCLEKIPILLVQRMTHPKPRQRKGFPGLSKENIESSCGYNPNDSLFFFFAPKPHFQSGLQIVVQESFYTPTVWLILTTH